MANPERARIRAVARELRARSSEAPRGLIGFDGFVDEIVEVVRTRTSPERYARVETISEFAERIAQAAGLSTNIELVPTQVKLGGNGPIMANALAFLGFDILYVGSVGYPEVHPVFADFASRCRVVGVADPGHTLACEFTDGKVMLGRTQSLNEVTWERILASIDLASLREAFATSGLFAAVNWTMLPHMTGIWTKILEEALPDRRGPAKPIAFFDLADPQKRDRNEILSAVRTIERFAGWSRPILGLNRKEAAQVADALGIEVEGGNRGAALGRVTRALGEALAVHAVVVHPTSEAAVWAEGRLDVVSGPYTSRPKLTTGAGDNFNAGFCLGQALEMGSEASLILGVGTSGFYVRQGRSPSRDELAAFLDTWADRAGEDF